MLDTLRLNLAEVFFRSRPESMFKKRCNFIQTTLNSLCSPSDRLFKLIIVLRDYTRSSVLYPITRFSILLHLQQSFLYLVLITTHFFQASFSTNLSYLWLYQFHYQKGLGSKFVEFPNFLPRFFLSVQDFSIVYHHHRPRKALKSSYYFAK